MDDKNREFRMLNRAVELSEGSQIILVFCDNGEKRQDIFDSFVKCNKVSAKRVDSNAPYGVFANEPNTVFFIDCLEDFQLQYFNIIKITATTNVFFLTEEQRKVLFYYSETQRRTVLDFNNEEE